MTVLFLLPVTKPLLSIDSTLPLRGGAAGDKEKAMLAFEKAIRKDKFADVAKFQNESMLLKLEEHPKWNTLFELVKKNKNENDARIEKPLAAQLETIFEYDQADRLKFDSIQKRFGWNSKEMREQWQVINRKDSLNLLAVKKILDQRGWLGSDIVGELGNSALFLVIQHSDSASQKKYLPLLRKAAMEGNAKPSELALLEDRTRTTRGEKQLYGSQLKTNPVTEKLEFYPIEDEGNVNKRRAEMGLEPLEEYAKRFGLHYALSKQK